MKRVKKRELEVKKLYLNETKQLHFFKGGEFLGVYQSLQLDTIILKQKTKRRKRKRKIEVTDRINQSFLPDFDFFSPNELCRY